MLCKICNLSQVIQSAHKNCIYGWMWSLVHRKGVGQVPLGLFIKASKHVSPVHTERWYQGYRLHLQDGIAEENFKSLQLQSASFASWTDECIPQSNSETVIGSTAPLEKVGWQFLFYISITVTSVNTMDIYSIQCFSFHVNTNGILLISHSCGYNKNPIISSS